MKLDGKRILRTAIQSGAGAGISLITAISADWSRDAVIAAIMEFVTTVVVAVLMNIETQAKDGENDE